MALVSLKIIAFALLLIIFSIKSTFYVMGIPWHPLFSDPNYPKVTLFPDTSGTAASHPSFALAKTVTRQWSPNPHHADTV